MNKQLIFKLATGLLLFSVLLTACGGAPAAPAANLAAAAGLPPVITLAAVEDLTGRNAIYGKPIQMGIDLAVKQVNEQKYLGEGVTLKVEYSDSASDTDKAVAAFKSLVGNKGIVAILGPTISTQAVAADPLAQAAKMPVVASSNTASGITDIGDYIFRTSLPESAVVPNTVNVVVKALALKKAAIIYGTDDTFTASAEKIFKDSLTAAGVEIVTEETFKTGDTEFNAQLTKIKGLAPDAIVVAALSNEAAKIMMQARAMGIPASVPFIGGNSFNSLQVPQAAGGAGEGAISGSAWSLGSAVPASVAFVQAFNAEYKSDPDQFAAQSYTAAWVIAVAIKNARSIDHNAVREALTRIKNFDSPLGFFSFSINRDPLHEPVVLIVKNGKFEVFQP